MLFLESASPWAYLGSRWKAVATAVDNLDVQVEVEVEVEVEVDFLLNVCFEVLSKRMLPFLPWCSTGIASCLTA